MSWLALWLCFIGAFAKLRKRLLASPRLSVCLSVPHDTIRVHRTDFFYEILNIKKTQEYYFYQYLIRITCILNADQYTFMTISCWILLRMTNALDKSCRENQNTHFVFNNVYQKIVPFMR